MLAGWLPCWERASHIALHHVHACCLIFVDVLYCSLFPIRRLWAGILHQFLNLVFLFTRIRHAFLREVIQFTRARDNPGLRKADYKLDMMMITELLKNVLQLDFLPGQYESGYDPRGHTQSH